MYAARSAGTTSTRKRLPGHRKFMKRNQSRASGHLPRLRAHLGAPQTAHRREPNDRTNEILFGRELEGVHADAPERCAERLIAALHDLGEALPETLVRGIDVKVLTRLGVVHDDPADLRQLALPRVGEADREHLMAAREIRESALPP